MRAAIITIGDEILIGQIVDTNSAWLGQELGRLGISVVQRTSVSDKKEAIMHALDEVKKHAELIILTGGLGPTKDDVTKTTLCEYFNTKLVINDRVLNWVTEIFTSRKLPMLDSNKLQAMVPENCEVLFNRSGTAPGMWFDQGAHAYISMPGVPFEMKTIFSEECVPKIMAKFNPPAILHRTILTASIGESFLAKKIEGWENSLPAHIRLAYLPSVGQVRLRLSGTGESAATLEEEMNGLIAQLYEIAGDYIFGEEHDSLEKNTGLLLIGKNCTVATAESCTGGYIAHLITSVPGSSAYYKGSIIAYDNTIKQNELGVSGEILKSAGAVSEQCVTAMAENIRKKFGTDYSIATSGIAGPGGGTEHKPVGTVWIAVSSASGTTARQFNMGDNRERTIQRASIQALDMLRKMLAEDE